MTKCLECEYSVKDSIEQPVGNGRVVVEGIWCPRKGMFIANEHTKLFAEECRFCKIIK